MHVVPDRWILESNAGELGRAFDWICAMVGITAAEADALATAAPVGSGDAMAVLGPRVMRASAMNAGIGGITMPLPLVMSAPDRGHVLRSVLEATAYAVRANLEQIEQIASSSATSIAIGGGMSRSALFTQIVADVLDRSIEIASAPETSALGAAALAAAAVGAHPSLSEALRAIDRRPPHRRPALTRVSRLRGSLRALVRDDRAVRRDGRRMSDTYLAERQQVLEAVQRIVAAGLVSGSSGNVSRRIATPNGDLFAVTASRVPYHRFGIDDVLVVDGEVEPVVGDGVPSSESLAHMAVYRARPDVGAVIHTHSVYASAFAVAAQPIPCVLDEQVVDARRRDHRSPSTARPPATNSPSTPSPRWAIGRRCCCVITACLASDGISRKR